MPALSVGDCGLSGGVASSLLVQPNVVWSEFTDYKSMAQLNIIRFDLDIVGIAGIFKLYFYDPFFLNNYILE